MEPFVIVMNRQFSVVHPIYKLLYPHFWDTMNINAFTRKILINGGGVLELTSFSGKGVAVDDESSPNGLRLLIKDYPYTVDGLEIWFAIEKWVKDYYSFYYKIDEMTLLGISFIEILSRHSSDEVYLGQRAILEGTSDKTPLAAFDEFEKWLFGIEERIVEMKNNEQLKNRVGPINMPYTLLYPTSEGGLTGKGIPNSVSI
ncbi:hypothetical protein PVK06_017754 [Gossypium arboreum]|uniref:Lipoxygenase domain-containing protein n=1 Tax=Gossypium arboreum TaxID=29729 RepID=A0ABR0Q4S2_GOSAR|nr:hypothetical protein PVK06_017754 [Gossypium arboreum]